MVRVSRVKTDLDLLKRELLIVKALLVSMEISGIYNAKLKKTIDRLISTFMYL